MQWNSLLIQAPRTVVTCRRVVAGAPGVPNIEGSATDRPRSTRRSANATTVGVMPGISAATSTLRPSPRWYTSWVIPSWVNGSMR